MWSQASDTPTLVVPEGGKNLVALTMITGHIRHYLDEGHDEI